MDSCDPCNVTTILECYFSSFWPTLQWRHNGREYQITSLTIVYSNVYSGADKKKTTSKLRVTGFSVGNSPVTGEFPAEKASNTDNVYIWRRYHVSATSLALGQPYDFYSAGEVKPKIIDDKFQTMNKHNKTGK